MDSLHEISGQDLSDSLTNVALLSQNYTYMDTQCMISPGSPAPDFTFESFMSDTLQGPNLDTGDDLVTFIERFTNEIQEPSTNQIVSSQPTLQDENSQFLLANIVGSTSDLLEPLLSPDCGTDKLLSDVLFQETDACMHTTVQSSYPGSDLHEHEDTISGVKIESPRNENSGVEIPRSEMEGDEPSEEPNVSSSENDQSDSSVPCRITRSRSLQVKPTKSPINKKQTKKRNNNIPSKTATKFHQTRSLAKYSIQTRSGNNPGNSEDFVLKPKRINREKVAISELRLRNRSIPNRQSVPQNVTKKKAERIEKIIPEKPEKSDRNSKTRNMNKSEENLNFVKQNSLENSKSEEIDNEKSEKDSQTDSKANNSLDTSSTSKMLDVKISIVPCSPRTPKSNTTTDKQVIKASPVIEPTNPTRTRLTPNDTYNRFIPPLPSPPKRKRGRPRKYPVLSIGHLKATPSRHRVLSSEPLRGRPRKHSLPSLLDPLRERTNRRNLKSGGTYIPSSSDNTDSRSEERDESYAVRSNRTRTYTKRQRPVMIARSYSSDDDESEDDIISEECKPLTSYSIYRPSRLRFGYQHPDPIVETTSLSSVEPPNIWFDLSLPKDTLSRVCLSDMQLEAIVYACQQHCNILSNGERAGFLIGDGAGVGKGRIIAGIIHQNYIEGRKKGLWLSVSNDLRYDAMRDLRDIGANRIVLHALNKFKYGKISGKRNGGVKKGIIFSTYSSLISGSSASGKYRTRLSQILHWLGPHFEGVIVLDECHKAKNLYPTTASMKPSKTGNVVLELQRRLPKARIVYCSATGASEVKHLAYMVRLGLWGSGTQFQTFQEFNRAVEKGGVGAMELVAMDMKLRGLYVSRQLSFNSVQFQIQEVPLTQAYIEVYNIACKFWVECRQKFLEALKLLSFDNRKMKYVMALFWAAHQRFFKYLCIASKVQGAVRLAKHAIRDNMCVVIGLQSTGESRLLDVLEERGGEISEFVSSAKGVLVTLIQRHFPAPYTSVKKKVIRKDVDNDLKSAVQAEASDSPVGSNPERDSALESDNSNSDTSEVNWEAVPSGDPGESLYTRYISSSETSAEDLNPFAEGSVPWLATKKTKKLKLDIEDDIPPEPEHSSPVAKQPQVLEMKEESPKTDPRDVYQITKNMKQDLLGRVEEIGVVLPNNTLDELIDCLGGPSQVSEMTGRKGRVVTQNVDTAVDEMEPGIKYERRSCLDVPIDLLNMEEKRRFMDGEVDIAIISEAASSGISLHADKRYKNQKQRLHITLELPWTADKAVQQFGRTHRSNQAMPPQYLFLISELAGERRFASVIARRLESLGALTRGDRKAASVESNDFSRFNFDTRDGLLALDSLLRCLIGRVSPLASSLRSADISTRQAAINALITVDILSRTPKGKITLDKESNSVSKFLNRLLGIEVQLQNTIFQWFLDTFDFLVKQAKRLGNWDNGIVEMGTNAGEEVERIKMEEFLG